MTPRRAFFPTILSLLLVLSGCGEGGGARGPGGVLRWGGDAEGGAPFVEADPANPAVVHGFDVEIAEMIARGLGREPRFVQVAWASIGQSVERGDFELGMSGLEDGPELRAQHAVTIPYYEFYEVLAVRPGDRDRFRTLAELAGRRVATLGGTTAYDILLESRGGRGSSPSRTTTTSTRTPTWRPGGWTPCCWTT
jgi:polar amino acid transport system substrate-binding protein